MTKVVDPLGGSYYVEALTQELVDKALGDHRARRGRGRHGQGGRRGLAQGDDRGSLRRARRRGSIAART